MVWEIVFWLSLVGTLGYGAMLFRDLGDVSQLFFKVKRADISNALAHVEAYSILSGRTEVSG